MGQLVTGVNLNQPDVGGSRAMQQTYMSTRGLTSANNIVQVDGMMINGLDGDGAVQQYVNNAIVQEMTYQTAGAGADVSPGGVRVNIVPQRRRQRVQRVVLRRLERRRLAVQQPHARAAGPGPARVDKIERIWDFNVAIGGPIKRDKLWFFGSARHWGVHPDRGHVLRARRAQRKPTARPGAWPASRGSTTSRSTAPCCA